MLHCRVGYDVDFLKDALDSSVNKIKIKVKI